MKDRIVRRDAGKVRHGDAGMVVLESSGLGGFLLRVSVSPRRRVSSSGRFFDQPLDHLVERGSFLIVRPDADKSHYATPIEQESRRNSRDAKVPIIVS